MDALSFDGYASYSDSSAPRTPSPRTDDPEYVHPHYSKDIEPVRNIFADNADDAYWGHPQQHPQNRGSLLQELYEHDSPDVYQEQHQHHPQQQQQYQQRPADYTMVRRATFPYVRQDRDDNLPMAHYPPFMQSPHHHQPSFSSARPDVMYQDQMHYYQYDDESVKLEDGNNPLVVPSQSPPFYRPSSTGSPPMHPMHHLGPMHHPMSPPMPGQLSTYLSPHTGLPVQHTDDAASKETQYLRRRCFNCHTTEPPSWRRSTLNPGKIVCNKCGLYERTHLRPRPLRFDELRAGNKARKGAKTAAAAANGGVPPANGAPAAGVPGGSPKSKHPLVKKESREYGSSLMRRSSVSSTHSSAGASDWDDSVSIYSSGSAPPTSFNSPSASSFSLSRDSQSPPRDGQGSPSMLPPSNGNGIRLPNNPLSDIASLTAFQQAQAQRLEAAAAGGSPSGHDSAHTSPKLGEPSPSPSPRKAHSAPSYPQGYAQNHGGNGGLGLEMNELSEEMMVVQGDMGFFGGGMHPNMGMGMDGMMSIKEECVGGVVGVGA